MKYTDKQFKDKFGFKGTRTALKVAKNREYALSMGFDYVERRASGREVKVAFIKHEAKTGVNAS